MAKAHCITRRAAFAGAVALAAVPAAAASADNLAEIERLIEAHQAAIAEHDRLFDLNDQGRIPDSDLGVALDHLDDALVSICAAVPTSERARKRRWAYLSKRLVSDTYCHRDLTKRVFEVAFA